MPDLLDVQKSLKPFLFLPISTSIGAALTLLQNARVPFAFTGTDAHHPRALLQESQLQALSDKHSQPLAGELEHFSPMLVIDLDAEQRGLGIQDIQQLALLLKSTQGIGVIVFRHNQAEGIIPRKAILSAMPLSAIPIPGLEQRLYGEAETGPRTYICRKCPAPQPRRRPLQGDEIPLCPNEPDEHGEMEKE